jgi:23S rRNA (cytosine1962-C5)-methyltransferase
MNTPYLYLKKNEDRRIRAGHLWVFSNEVDTAKSPLTSFEPGQEVMVAGANGKNLGLGYVNPRSLIAARVCTRTPGDRLDAAFLRKRLREALALRERVFSRPFYRLVFGEGDYLPGLVVDRYDSILAVQITTAGMERLKDDILAVLAELVAPSGIVLRNDTPSRELEGLPLYAETAAGEVPDEVVVQEGTGVFRAPLARGQKTGWFYDQRANRQALARYVADKRVLDVFSYVGGFGVTAALAGAREVVCLDASELAAWYVGRNAEENRVESVVRAVQADADRGLEQLIEAGEKFDVVCIDPPAFIKRKRDAEVGAAAYLKFNKLAMRLLADDAILMSCSCSQHLPADDLRRIALRAGNETGRRLQVLEQGRQAVDHPVHPAMPETEYLKAFVLRALG